MMRQDFRLWVRADSRPNDLAGWLSTTTIADVTGVSPEDPMGIAERRLARPRLACLSYVPV
jgi:hypothetical protein